MRAIRLIIVITLTCSVAGAVSAASDNRRNIAVVKALDTYERGKFEAKKNISSPASKPRMSRDQAPQAKDIAAPAPAVAKQRNSELAIMFSSILFETDDKWPYYYTNWYHYSESDMVTKKGSMVGLYGSHTWRLRDPIRSWGELWRANSMPTTIKVEADIATGQVSYDSYLTGERKGYNAWEFDGRVLGGYSFQLNPSTVLTPYLGLGWRQYTDKTGGYVDDMIFTYAEFPTKYSFFYIPVGIESSKRLNDQWDLDLKLEGDFVMFGSIKYGLSDIEGTFDTTDATTGEPITVIFKDADTKVRGFGFRTSGKIIRKFKDYNLFFEPFLKYWRMESSDEVQTNAYAINNGKDYVSLFGDGKTPRYPLFDPASQTVTSGFRIGAQF